ncbi:thiol:disulfide interchange protein DsbG [Pantoea stewartii]|uniref:thiol:disulfide interchange protein DsbG n=1 Tax=Pantoea stewartii TaxID=66269 RepID=UPI002DB6E090|nr:thiol:disulfide interchange protein DsbG [Pantoea stewartii]MEB6537087.1 thiol:disulfide interchange protein DsbG [Pantoea stewartii]
MKTFRLLLFAALFSAATQAAPLPAAIQQIEKQGVKIIKPFEAPGGVKGWLGSYQGTGVTLYLTPDGQHAISGYMYDAQGQNLSEKIINEELYLPAGRAMWKRLQAMPGLDEGSKAARCKVVVFADPFCPYCRMFWQQTQPLVKNNTLRITTLLVGILTPESGRYASAILAAADPAQAWREWEGSQGKNTPTLPVSTPRALFDQIQHNQALMQELGANGTPAVYYLNREQKLQQIVGMPDKKQMADLVNCE